jgi:phosphoglycerate kinase
MSETFAGLRTVQDAQVEDRVALVRVDYNVPMDGGHVSDDSRIRASLPTLRLLLERGAKLVLVSHLGRPEGRVVAELSLAPIAEHLGQLLGIPVSLLDAQGDEARAAIDAAPRERVHLLENVRFHAEETGNEYPFARWLAGLGDVFVNDAFAALHRAHASTVGVADYLPAYAGLLVQHELDALKHLLDSPQRPYLAVIGGKKAKSKLGPLRDLVNSVDEVLVGGGVAFTLLAAQGFGVGATTVEEHLVAEVRGILDASAERGTQIHLPVDVVTAPAPDADADAIAVHAVESIPDDRIGFDIGPSTVSQFTARIAEARSAVWTGPMGMYEAPAFAAGTQGVAAALAASEAYTVVGGGETGEATLQLGFADRMSHISTGGGACLALLRHKRLLALEALRG